MDTQLFGREGEKSYYSSKQLNHSAVTHSLAGEDEAGKVIRQATQDSTVKKGKIALTLSSSKLLTVSRNSVNVTNTIERIDKLDVGGVGGWTILGEKLR